MVSVAFPVGVISCYALEFVGGGFKEENAIGVVGQSLESRSAMAIRSDLEIESPEAQNAELYVHLNLGSINWSSTSISNRELY